jgi:hypothetical protein
MASDASTSIVREIMSEFADLTGLSSRKTPQRYLWTDAFAVCNFIELYNRTGDSKYLHLALSLVDQVHHVLGRHREDDSRKGWISGLGEKEGEKRPAAGGLRIGKKINERRPADPFDERLEWERDGQYYHYLTKWMHALNRVSRVTGEPTYNVWAIELAKTAHAKFIYVPSSRSQKRMYWKMSIDLSYPLVPSMGHHDPLDGFITYNQLQATATRFFKGSAPDLSAEISDMADICKGKSWVTEDTLGIGDLLCNAYKAAQLATGGNFEETDLPGILLDSSLPGLESYARTNSLELPADYRLAFRELGLAIGLRAVEKLRDLIEKNPDFFNKKHNLYPGIEAVMEYVPLSKRIDMFWLDHRNKEYGSWIEHRDINMVMLATSLAPDAYLTV